MNNRKLEIRSGAYAGIVALLATHFMLAGCTEIPRGSTEKNDLSAMRFAHVEITGRTAYMAYVADDTRSIQLGLMNTTEDELPANRGMLFDLGYDSLLNFWMRNTIIPLDIAFIRSDGTIVKTYTMMPLDESGYPSIEPARFALEVRGGQFAQWGIMEGDQVEIFREGVPSGSSIKNDLGSMPTVDIEIRDRATYTAYVADNACSQQIGLMNTSTDELPTDRGMIFVFESDLPRAFWMRNTIIPLDIAYINSDGTIVKTYTMQALDESQYPSGEPARFALEVRAGQFDLNDIHEGDHVEIPATLLNPPS